MKARTVKEAYIQDEVVNIDKYTPSHELIDVIHTSKHMLNMPKSTRTLMSISPKEFRKARIKALGLLRSRGFSRQEIQDMLTESVKDLMDAPLSKEEYTEEMLMEMPLLELIKMVEGHTLVPDERYRGENKMALFSEIALNRLGKEGKYIEGSENSSGTWDSYTLFEIPDLEMPKCVMRKRIAVTHGSNYTLQIVIAKKNVKVKYKVDWDATRSMSESLTEGALFPSTKLKKDKVYVLYNWDNEKPTQIKIKDINQATDEVTFIASGDETIESWFNISKVDNISDNGKIILKESAMPNYDEDHPWNKIYNLVDDMAWNGRIKDEDQLRTIVGFWQDQNKFGLTADDIEDAAWAAWSDQNI